MLLVKANAESEAGVMPSQELLAAMGRYNEALVRAGVMLAGDGLQPSAKGARVRWSGGGISVTGGPFAEAKQLIAGYWIIQVRSKDEAIEWVRRCPAQMGDGEAEIEIRQVFELDDFGPSEAAEPVRNQGVGS
jgi:hypothetical protein